MGDTTASNVTSVGGQAYPMTKMNFRVAIGSSVGYFTEISGIDASVDVIEYRTGNYSRMAPMKMPGLVKHGNITFKYGLVSSYEFRQWILKNVSESDRAGAERRDIVIELLDVYDGAKLENEAQATASKASWTLKNCFVAKYSGADLDAKSSDVAVESLEVAYEELIFPAAGGQ